MVWFGRCSEPEESNVDPCCALRFVTWKAAAAAGRRWWFCCGISWRWAMCRIRGLPVSTGRGTQAVPSRAASQSPGPCLGSLGQAAELCPSGTCCPFPSECPVPSPAIFCQRLSRLWLRCCTGSTQVSCPHRGTVPGPPVTSPSLGCCIASDFCMLYLYTEHPTPC